MRRREEIEANTKRTKKQDEQEQLLMKQKANNLVELEEYELTSQEMEEEEEMFAPSPAVVKEQEEEALREVDALLEERLGEFVFGLHCIGMYCCGSEIKQGHLSRWVGLGCGEVLGEAALQEEHNASETHCLCQPQAS